jgi:uncharacterized membrane protein (UPF0136 family)
MHIRQRKTWIGATVIYILASIVLPRAYIHMAVAGYLPFVPPDMMMAVGKGIMLAVLASLVILTFVFFRKLTPDEKTLWIALLIAITVFSLRAYAFFNAYQVAPVNSPPAHAPQNGA